MTYEVLILGAGVGALLSAAGFLQKRKMLLNDNSKPEAFDWFKFGQTVFWNGLFGLAGSLLVTDPQTAAGAAGLVWILKTHVFQFSFQEQLETLWLRLQPKKM